MRGTDLISRTQNVSPICFHMKEVAEANIVLQFVNDSPSIIRLNPWPLASRKLSNRIYHLDSMPWGPQKASVGVQFKGARGREMMSIFRATYRHVECGVGINVHERRSRMNATVSNFLPVGLESSSRARLRQSLAVLGLRDPALVTIRSGLPLEVTTKVCPG